MCYLYKYGHQHQHCLNRKKLRGMINFKLNNVSYFTIVNQLNLKICFQNLCEDLTCVKFVVIKLLVLYNQNTFSLVQ